MLLKALHANIDDNLISIDEYKDCIIELYSLFFSYHPLSTIKFNKKEFSNLDAFIVCLLPREEFSKLSEIETNRLGNSMEQILIDYKIYNPDNDDHNPSLIVGSINTIIELIVEDMEETLT